MNFGGAIVVETRVEYSVAVPVSAGDTVGGGGNRRGAHGMLMVLLLAEKGATARNH